MTLKGTLTFLGLLVLAGVLAFAAAGRADLVKPDAIAAIGCTQQLLIGSPDPMRVITSHRDIIAREARSQDLPPELMAVIIYNHQGGLTPFRRFTDCFGSAIGYNLSLGPAQLRMSTAIEDSGRQMAELSPAEFHAIRRDLLDPATNIAYQARELRLLLDRKHRFPGIGADAVIHTPEVTALVMSEYRSGRTATPSESTRLSGAALFGMRYLLDDRLYLFDRPAADVAEIQQKVRTYLDYIACDSGIYNDSVCAEWKANY